MKLYFPPQVKESLSLASKALSEAIGGKTLKLPSMTVKS